MSNIASPNQLNMLDDASLTKYAAAQKAAGNMANFSLAFQISNDRSRMRQQAAAQAMGGVKPPVADVDLQQMAVNANQVPNTPTGIPQAGAGSVGQAPEIQNAAKGGLLPEHQGIGKLRAKNLEAFADGGITGYADEGLVNKDPKQAFAQQYQGLATQVAQQLGVSPGVVIAHWGQESAWGKKPVGQYNFGNIKDFSGKGTKAFDKSEKSTSAYRNYDDPQDFANDYVDQIKRNFPKAVGAGSDIRAFASGLQNGRLGQYASDANYGKHLTSTFNSILPFSSAQAETVPGAQPKATAPAPTATSNEPTQAELDAASKPAFVTPSSGKGRQAGPISNAIASGQGQLQMLQGAGDTAYDIAGIVPNAVWGGYHLLGGKTPEEKFWGTTPNLKKSFENLGIRPKDSTDPTMQGFRTFGNVLAAGVNPVAAAETSGTAVNKGLAALAASKEAAAAKAAQKTEALRLPDSGVTLYPPAPHEGFVEGVPNLRIAPENIGPDAQAIRQGQQMTALEQDQAAAAKAGQEAVLARQQAQASAKPAITMGEATPAAEAVKDATLATAAAPTAQAVLGGASSASADNGPDFDKLWGPGATVGDVTNYKGPAEAPSVKDIGKTVTDTGGGRDWNDFLLNLGLGLMAGQSPYALQNLGTAGIGALKAEREQKNQALQDAYLKAKTTEATNASDLDYQAKLARLKAEPFNPAKAYADVYLPGHERAASVPGSTLGAPMTFAEFARMFPVATTQPSGNATIYSRD